MVQGAGVNDPVFVIGASLCRSKDRDYLPVCSGDQFLIINIVTKETAMALGGKAGIAFNPPAAAEWRYWAILSSESCTDRL